ncbi:hypothetical protein BB559_006324 [Furculomyces boomerangus]|uniref:Uncharacterized protein n=1 Tax=Furculomyces boomerangus TaxID=61424 RepID=A0A2T9Y3L3_9FUNG|nr:hypothetical protein BB559_007397 [Furculomyces boomerangus]PVU86930.1 hypothetical protein BB559_006324 [Furculomyces boomerangus]
MKSSESTNSVIVKGNPKARGKIPSQRLWYYENKNSVFSYTGRKKTGSSIIETFLDSKIAKSALFYTGLQNLKAPIGKDKMITKKVLEMLQGVISDAVRGYEGDVSAIAHILFLISKIDTEYGFLISCENLTPGNPRPIIILKVGGTRSSNNVLTPILVILLKRRQSTQKSGNNDTEQLIGF